MKALSSFCPLEHMPLKGRWIIKTKSLRAHAHKGKQLRWMSVKRLRPIYRLTRRLIINGLKIKAINLNSYRNIKSSVDETRGFLLREHQGHKSPTVNADLALKDPTKSLRRIACDALEVASWSPHPFTRLGGHVPFIKLKKTKQHSLNDPERGPLRNSESHPFSNLELRLLSDPDRVP